MQVHKTVPFHMKKCCCGLQGAKHWGVGFLHMERHDSNNYDLYTSKIPHDHVQRDMDT